MKQLKIEGLPVVDATKKMALRIGALDIPRSKHRDPASCVAARACLRDLSAEKARVHLSRVYLKFPAKKQWMRFSTPPALRSEIVAFDRGGRFSPGDYALMPVAASHRASHDRHKKSQKERGVKRGNGKKRTYHVTAGVRTNAHGEMAG